MHTIVKQQHAYAMFVRKMNVYKDFPVFYIQTSRLAEDSWFGYKTSDLYAKVLCCNHCG